MESIASQFFSRSDHIEDMACYSRPIVIILIVARTTMSTVTRLAQLVPRGVVCCMPAAVCGIAVRSDPEA